jgi:hypothetical protein
MDLLKILVVVFINPLRRTIAHISSASILIAITEKLKSSHRALRLSTVVLDATASKAHEAQHSQSVNGGGRSRNHGVGEI